MDKNHEKLLEADGWEIECESPFEIRHIETGSFASGLAANVILGALVNEEIREQKRIVKAKLRKDREVAYSEVAINFDRTEGESPFETKTTNIS